MKTTLSILTSKGDQELTWDPANPAEVTEARAAVLALKMAGWSFFLVDGTQAPDEVSAGNGALRMRRVSAEELLAAEPQTPSVEPDQSLEAQAAPVPAAPEAPRARRGRRPRTVETQPAGADRKVVAVPRMAGG